MTIGFSLPVTYLGNSFQTEDDQLWFDIFGPPLDALKQLKKLGVASIEINKVRSTTQNELVQKAVETVLTNDLGITIHGWLPSRAEDLNFLALTQSLNQLLKDTKYQTIPLVVHGHSVLDTTLTSLDWYGEKLANQGSPLILALEICRVKVDGPVGRTYFEVLSILEQLEFKQLGICWDLGHTQANLKTQHLNAAYPDLECSKQIIHTHIHDIGEDGRTHFPVISDQDYVAKGVQLLKDTGFKGVYNLELYPPRWNQPAEKCGELIERSVTTLASLSPSN